MQSKTSNFKNTILALLLGVGLVSAKKLNDMESTFDDYTTEGMESFEPMEGDFATYNMPAELLEGDYDFENTYPSEEPMMLPMEETLDVLMDQTLQEDTIESPHRNLADSPPISTKADLDQDSAEQSGNFTWGNESFPASNAFALGTKFTHTEHGVGQWWEVQFKQSYTVDRVRILNRGDCCGERLAGTTVMIDDQQCGSVEAGTVNGEWYEVKCSNPITGGKVKLVTTQSTFLSISGIEVWTHVTRTDNILPWAEPQQNAINLHGNEFSEDDVFFSNQGNAGTCVRHAVAKGIQREIGVYTKSQHKFHTLALVQFLVNAHKMGADGTYVTSYNGASGQLVGDGGAIYSLEISVTKVPKGQGHVQIVELHKFWNSWKKGHDLHAMFSQYGTKDGGLRLRNSWGNAAEWLDIPANRTNDINRSFYIHIKNLKKHNYGGTEEVLCENYVWKKF